MTITLSPRAVKLLTALFCVALGVAAGLAVSAAKAGAVSGVNEDLAYTAVTPCAVFDSRTGTGPYAGPYLGDFNAAGTAFNGVNNKTVRVTGSGLAPQGANDDCGIPAGVSAVHINIVAIQAQTLGNVVVVDAGGIPSGGIVNYQVLSPGLNNSNAHTVPVSAAGELDVYANCGEACVAETVHVRGVVLGYYTDNLAVQVVALTTQVDQLTTLLAGVSRAGDNLSFPGDINAANAPSTVLCPYCSLSFADLRNAHLSDANLTDADIRNSNLSGANLGGTKLAYADLAYADLTGANLSGANLAYADLTGANLSGANLSGAYLAIVTWSNTTCPDGSYSSTNGTSPQSCIGHLVP